MVLWHCEHANSSYIMPPITACQEQKVTLIANTTCL